MPFLYHEEFFLSSYFNVTFSVSLMSRLFRENVPADEHLQVDFVIEVPPESGGATREVPFAIVRFPTLTTEIVKDYGERGEKIRMGNVQCTVEMKSDMSPGMLKHEKQPNLKEGDDVEILDLKSKAWVPRRVKKVFPKEKTVQVETIKGDGHQVVPNEYIRAKILSFRHPIPAVWEGSWEENEIRKEREAKQKAEEEKAEEKRREATLLAEVEAVRSEQNNALGDNSAEEGDGEEEHDEGEDEIETIEDPNKVSSSSDIGKEKVEEKDIIINTCTYDEATNRWITYWVHPSSPSLKLRLPKGFPKGSKAQLFEDFLTVNVLPALLQESVKFRWLGGSPAFAYQRGTRLRNIRIAEANDNLFNISGTIQKKDKHGLYQVRVDNSPSAVLQLDPTENNHRPAEEYHYCRETWLSIERGDEERVGWSDAKVLECFHGSYSLVAVDESCREEDHAFDFDANEVNHSVRRLPIVEYSRALEQYLEMIGYETEVVDALTGCTASIKDQTIRLEISSDSKCSSLSKVENISDIVQLMTKRQMLRTMGSVISHLVVLRANAGAGKTWAAKQFLYAVAETIHSEGTKNGVVPLLIKVQELTELSSHDLNFANSHLVHWYLEKRYRENGEPQICDMLLQAFESRRLVLIIDGIDEISYIKDDILNFIASELQRQDGRNIFLTCRPETVNQAFLDACSSITVLSLKMLNDGQKVKFYEGLLCGLQETVRSFFENIYQYRKASEDDEIGLKTLEYFRQIFAAEVPAALDSDIQLRKMLSVDECGDNSTENDSEEQEQEEEDSIIILLRELGFEDLLEDLEAIEVRKLDDITALDVNTLQQSARIPLRRARKLMKAAKTKNEELQDLWKKEALETVEEKAEKAHLAEIRVTAKKAAKFLSMVSNQKCLFDKRIIQKREAESELKRRLALLCSFLEDPTRLALLIIAVLGAIECGEVPKIPRTSIDLYALSVNRLVTRVTRKSNFTTADEEKVMKLLSRVAFWNHEHQNKIFTMEDIDGSGKTNQASTFLLELAFKRQLPLIKVIVFPEVEGPKSKSNGLFRFHSLDIQCFLGSMRLLERLDEECPHGGGGAAMWNPYDETSITACLSDSFYSNSIKMLSEVQSAPRLMFPTQELKSKRIDQEGFERLLELHSKHPALKTLAITNNGNISSIPSSWYGGRELLELYITKCDSLRGSLVPLSVCRDLKKLLITDCCGLGGEITAEVITWLSCISEKHIQRCGEFILTNALEGLEQNQIIELSFVDTLKGNFERLANLMVRGLGLQNCYKFTCKLQPKVVQWLSAMEWKNLENCGPLILVDDLSSIKNSLDKLDLSTCSTLKGTLKPFEILTSLTDLNLERCIEIEGSLDAIKNLVDLTNLNLSYCKLLQGPVMPLEGLTRMKSMTLKYCDGLSGDLEFIRRMSSLESLDLGGCREIKGSLQVISSHTNLENLNMDGLENLAGTLVPLSKLIALQSISFQGCRLLAGSLEPLSSLSNLESLNLMRCAALAGPISGNIIRLLSSKKANLLYTKGPFTLAEDLRGVKGKVDLTALGSKLRGSLEPLAHLRGITHIDLRRCTKIEHANPDLFPSTCKISLDEEDIGRFADRRGSGRRVAEETEKIEGAAAKKKRSGFLQVK